MDQQDPFSPETPPTPPPQTLPYAGGLKEADPTARQWAMFCHLAAIAGNLFPFGHILGPLVLWLIKREEMPYVDDQGKEALNFQISLTIYAAISAVLVIVVVGFFLLLALWVFGLVCVIMAAIKANAGEPWRYPMTIRFVK